MNSNGWSSRLEVALEQRQQKRAYRRRRALEGGNGRWVRWQGCEYLNFSGNDYLGLARHPAVVSAWQHAAARYGVGSGGSGHVTGYSPLHQALEQRLAQWLGYPRALLFNAGYAANQAIITALTGEGDLILADRLSHASLLEAAMHSNAQLRRFAHNDTAALARLSNGVCKGQRLAITEGVFSMDGDQAPLPAIHQAIRRAGGWLIVDDAHGIGTLGAQGRGSAWQQDCQPELLMVTFGKAFGVGGAALLCSQTVAEYMLQFARHLIYSTALPPAQVAAIDCALTLVIEGDPLRQQLRDNIARFRLGATGLGYRLAESHTAIQPLLTGENGPTLALAEQLAGQGCWLTAIRPPTVPPGSARLRVTLSALHQPTDIDRLLEALASVTH